MAPARRTTSWSSAVAKRSKDSSSVGFSRSPFPGSSGGSNGSAGCFGERELTKRCIGTSPVLLCTLHTLHPCTRALLHFALSPLHFALPVTTLQSPVLPG